MVSPSRCPPWQPERPGPTRREPRRAQRSYTTRRDTIAVDAVLAIQTVGDSTSGAANARARQWGFDTLDRLEQIRTDLLLGAIPKERLISLAQMVSERRQHAEDPQLNELLDDIELRVRVEIAKFEPRKNAENR